MNPRIAGAVGVAMTLGALSAAHADLVLKRRVEAEMLMLPKREGGSEGEGECAVRVGYALASDPALQAPALLRLQTALHEIEFGGHGYLHLLELEPGLPLQWDEWQVLPSSEVPFRQKALEVRLQEVPPHEYDPPPGFKKIDFESSCVSLR